MLRLLKSIFLISSLLFFCSTVVLAAEEITITTYYPSPYGVYNQLQTSTLGVGDNNGNGVLDSGDVPNPATNPGDLWIKGQVKIAGGSPGAGKVLTSANASGLASWQAAGGGIKVFQEGSGYEGGIGTQTYCINKGYLRTVMLRYYKDSCAVHYDCCTSETTLFDWTHLVLDTDNSVIIAGYRNEDCKQGGSLFRQSHYGFQIMCSK